jgi:hypothetical protein
MVSGRETLQNFANDENQLAAAVQVSRAIAIHLLADEPA